jgi:glycerophosphoryl diester phosphodiesterase
MKLFSYPETGFHWLVDGLYTIRPQPFPGLARLQDCKIISHRGEYDKHAVFENTLSAFDRARDKGVWGIELDIRWTQDLQPVVIHDPNLRRVFNLDLRIKDVGLDELKRQCPQVPSLQEVIQRYGKRLHLMVEIKAEHYPDPLRQNRVLQELFSPLEPHADYHLLSLTPVMFKLIDFVPASAFIPVARLNFFRYSQLALQEGYRGFAGHYLFVSNPLLKRHRLQQQKIGTGYIKSKNCLFRELNRGVEWIFSNNAGELQTIVNELIRAQR